MALVLVSSLPALAMDAFEIQVYDAETAEPGHVGLETHVNSIVNGTRHTSPDGAWATDRVTHVTLEPHLGVLRWLELGGYVQGAVHPGPHLNWAGLKLRAKLRYPERVGGLLGFALNGECSIIPGEYEPARLGSEFRPVMDADWGPLYASVNPIVSVAWKGPDAARPALEPAATVLFKPLENLAAGLEYYADLGPVDHLDATSEQVHRLFAVVNVNRSPAALHLGAGYGLTGGERYFFKAIFSAELGP